MLVQDVMTHRVSTASPDEPAEQARAEMHLRGIHHLVVARGTDILGVISDRDLGGPHGDEVRRGRCVGDLMATNPICGTSAMTLREAAARMRQYAVGCLPIVDDDRLVGVVTTSNLLEAIDPGFSRPFESLRGHDTEVEAKHRALRVLQLMSRSPETIDVGATVRTAASQMAGRHIGFLPVCEGGGAVGVLTDRDLVVRVMAVGLDPMTTSVGQVMSRPVYRCVADATIPEARRIMEANVVRRLVVTDPSYTVVGVLSLDDLDGLPPGREARSPATESERYE